MPVLQDGAHLGGAWSLWPPGNAQQGLNYVRDDRCTAALILSALLLRPGEAPLHPELAIAPDIFEPLSNYRPQYWSHQALEHVQLWVGNVEDLGIWIERMPDATNSLTTYIAFRSVDGAHRNLLSFDFMRYQGASMDGSLKDFMDSVQFNGQSFTDNQPVKFFRGFER